MDPKANVMVDKDDLARLTGFGLTSIGQDDPTRTPQDLSMACTITWVAPEILRGGVANKEGDIFTFAMVAVEVRKSQSVRWMFLNLEQIFTGHPPFIADSKSALYDIMSGKRPQRPENLNYVGLWELIQRCWDQDPGKRPTTLRLVKFFHVP